MSRQRRTFTSEVKREAACLVIDQGYSHIEAVLRSLALVESALRRWVNLLQNEQKLQELEAQINCLGRESRF